MTAVPTVLQAGTAPNPISALLRELPFLSPAIADPIGQALMFVAAFLVIYLVGGAVVVPVVRRFLRSRDIDTHARRPLVRLVRYVVAFVAIAVAFGAAGAGNFLTALATIAAALTLAIGFAMQDTVKNFVAGVFIYTDEPFRIEDWIIWDGYEGVVEDISLRVTRVRTFDNELMTVPNATLTDGVVTNKHAKDTLRLRFTFGIGYDDDIGQATDIILEECANHLDIIDDPAPAVLLTELGDSAVGLNARFWIASPKVTPGAKVKADLIEAVKGRFDAEGVEFPYPHVTVTGSLANGAPGDD